MKSLETLLERPVAVTKTPRTPEEILEEILEAAGLEDLTDPTPRPQR